jgi:tryptophanyl-tRNA synthetase
MSLPQKPAPRVFSGMQPTGNLHLGNYLGAMVRWVEMQKSHECIFCVVDMHAITVWQDPKELKDQIRSVTAAYIAPASIPSAASCSTRARCPSTPSWPGCSTAWRGSAG